MNTFDNDVVEKAVMEAACMAFAGTEAEELTPFESHFSASFFSGVRNGKHRMVSSDLSMVITLSFTQTTSTLLVFLLAMLLYPEVQTKAHAEIDRIVGKDRLPDFDDRLALPYLDAILRETLRWHPVAPLGPYTIPLLFDFTCWYSQASHTQRQQMTSIKAISSLKACIMY
jgi:hypothetical protein